MNVPNHEGLVGKFIKVGTVSALAASAVVGGARAIESAFKTQVLPSKDKEKTIISDPTATEQVQRDKDFLSQPDLPPGFDYRGLVKVDKETGQMYQHDGTGWKEVEEGTGIGQFDNEVGGVRLDEWPDSGKFDFSHWATEPTYNPETKRWERVACYVGSGGMGCDVKYEVPAPEDVVGEEGAGR